MFRALPMLLLTMLLAPLSAVAHQAGTATPTASAGAIADPDLVVAAVELAAPPEELPGNEGEPVELVTWEDFYDEELDNAAGAWVLTGSPDLPIASVIVFESADNAQAGIADYRKDSAATAAGDLEAWNVADRGKWVCIAVDGAVMLIGQAEPQEGESDGDIQRRSCDAVTATHLWLLDQLPVAAATPSPGATPGD